MYELMYACTHVHMYITYLHLHSCMQMTMDGSICVWGGFHPNQVVLFLARKNHSSTTPLDRIRFAVLGLGDSNHLAASHRSIAWASGKDCNQVGELFDRWLAQLGGTRIVRWGKCEERTPPRRSTKTM